jgi:glycosyltransferase involved in cell wall biosynthesis
MIRAVASVIRGEGLASALRRANERIGDALHSATLRARGMFAGAAEAAILNVAASGTSTRLGGVQTQLVARLRAERSLRNVALLEPGVLELSAPSPHTRRMATDLETGIREAIVITGARTVHLEGMHGVPLAGVLRLIKSGIGVIVSVHDFSLFCTRPQLIEEPMGRFCFYSQDLDRCHRCLRQTWDVGVNTQLDRRTLARQLLASAKGVIFPSQFLLDQHRLLFSLPKLAGEVIEPGVPAAKSPIRDGGERRVIAYAGSAKRHKGAHLLPELARLAGNIDLHVFGGGDEDLLRAMRGIPNITIHGYYRSGELPSLLARHRIGMVVLPSIWPETYSLVLSEAWLAGAVVAAFDLGAQAERIRREGGGWLAPLESGASGLAEIVGEWMAGRATATTPRAVTSPADAARQHVDVYRKLGVLCLRTSASSADEQLVRR